MANRVRSERANTGHFSFVGIICPCARSGQGAAGCDVALGFGAADLPKGREGRTVTALTALGSEPAIVPDCHASLPLDDIKPCKTCFRVKLFAWQVLGHRTRGRLPLVAERHGFCASISFRRWVAAPWRRFPHRTCSRLLSRSNHAARSTSPETRPEAARSGLHRVAASGLRVAPHAAFARQHAGRKARSLSVPALR